MSLVVAAKLHIGLVIREPWLGMILAGHKTWELRSRPIWAEQQLYQKLGE